jgi:tRNA-2-methylthio-N6-dimethylallyladenosine synthase
MQSGSSSTLKRMLRRYTREGYFECAERLRRAVPNIALTTDIIVGFPGETDDEFGETLSAVREVGFDDAYTFKFSMRDGTPATRFPVELTVSDEVASERLAQLISVVREGSRARNMSHLGQRCEVLIEKEARRGGLLQARTRDFKTVIVPGNPEMIGEYVQVELTGTTGSTFTGAVIAAREALPMR